MSGIEAAHYSLQMPVCVCVYVYYMLLTVLNQVTKTKTTEQQNQFLSGQI